MWFFALQHMCNYQHMAQTQDLLFWLLCFAFLFTHMRVYLIVQISWLFALWGNMMLFVLNSEACREMRTLCTCVHLCVNPIIIIYNQ